MNRKEAIQLVIFEGTSEEGMVVEVHSGIDPGLPRVAALLDALGVVATAVAPEPTLDKALANALYGLSFHMTEALSNWEECAWLDEYVEILALIEAIFEGEE